MRYSHDRSQNEMHLRHPSQVGLTACGVRTGPATNIIERVTCPNCARSNAGRDAARTVVVARCTCGTQYGALAFSALVWSAWRTVSGVCDREARVCRDCGAEVLAVHLEVEHLRTALGVDRRAA